jgi:hypothetical protein
LNSGDALTFPRLEGSSVVDKGKTSEKLYTVLMIFSSVCRQRGSMLSLWYTLDKTITSADTVS